MKDIQITNIKELHSEILRLKLLNDEESIVLSSRFRSPAAVFGTALTLFPSSSALNGVTDAGVFYKDVLKLASRYLIPLTLNKTIFRHSNFLVKLMIGVLSQKAMGYVTGNSLEKTILTGKPILNKEVFNPAFPADFSEEKRTRRGRLTGFYEDNP